MNLECCRPKYSDSLVIHQLQGRHLVDEATHRTIRVLTFGGSCTRGLHASETLHGAHRGNGTLVVGGLVWSSI